MRGGLRESGRLDVTECFGQRSIVRASQASQGVSGRQSRHRQGDGHLQRHSAVRGSHLGGVLVGRRIVVVVVVVGGGGNVFVR